MYSISVIFLLIGSQSRCTKFVLFKYGDGFAIKYDPSLALVQGKEEYKVRKAPSKDVVKELCNEAFESRRSPQIPKQLLSNTSQQLNVKQAQASQVLSELAKLIHNAVFQGYSDAKHLIQLFPDDFHKNLRDLLVKVFIELLPQWKNQASRDTISLPRLVDFDWRVDVKTSSDSLARMSVPTCLLQMQIEEPCRGDGENSASNVTVELSRETLDTMLDGLGKIRDQLTSVTTKT